MIHGNDMKGYVAWIFPGDSPWIAGRIFQYKNPRIRPHTVIRCDIDFVNGSWIGLFGKSYQFSSGRLADLNSNNLKNLATLVLALPSEPISIDPPS